MSKSRREFLAQTSVALLGMAATGLSQAPVASDLPPGAPPAFGTAPPVGPEVSPTTFAEAEKLVRVELTDSERSMAADSWRRMMAGLYERRTGPRKLVIGIVDCTRIALGPDVAWNEVRARPGSICS